MGFKEECSARIGESFIDSADSAKTYDRLADTIREIAGNHIPKQKQINNTKICQTPIFINFFMSLFIYLEKGIGDKMGPKGDVTLRGSKIFKNSIKANDIFSEGSFKNSIKIFDIFSEGLFKNSLKIFDIF